MNRNPGIVQPDIDLQLNKPEIFIQVDRDRAADMGISVEAVARTVETMLGGRAVTRYKRGADQYDVLVQTDSRLLLAGAFNETALEHEARAHPGWQQTDYLGVVDRAGVQQLLGTQVHGGDPARLRGCRRSVDWPWPRCTASSGHPDRPWHWR